MTSKPTGECQISIPDSYIEFANKFYGEHGDISVPLLQFKLKVSHNMANDIIKDLNIYELNS